MVVTKKYGPLLKVTEMKWISSQPYRWEPMMSCTLPGVGKGSSPGEAQGTIIKTVHWRNVKANPFTKIGPYIRLWYKSCNEYEIGMVYCSIIWTYNDWATIVVDAWLKWTNNCPIQNWCLLMLFLYHSDLRYRHCRDAKRAIRHVSWL
jgi:hypothetical protein